MHVAHDFNVLVLLFNTNFPSKDQIFPHFGLQLIKNDFGRYYYHTTVDLNQIHIPFNTYSPILKLLNETNETHSMTKHSVRLHLYPYSTLRYAMFSPYFNRKMVQANQNPIL